MDDTTEAYSFVDTSLALSALLDALAELPTHPPSIYVDLEGEQLSRHGTISIIQIYISTMTHTYLIDVCALQKQTFTTRGSKGQTIQNILESSDIPKVIFDVRNDSDALFAHFGVRLAGVQDLQLMELATRPPPRKTVNGLAKCIETSGLLSDEEKLAWDDCKEKGLRLFLPHSGGSYKVFSQRPLSEEILRYCIQDVHYMPRLWAFYASKMTSKWWKKVESTSMERIRQSQSSRYVSRGKSKAGAPRGWLNA